MNPDHFEYHKACGSFQECNNAEGCDNCEYKGEE